MAEWIERIDVRLAVLEGHSKHGRLAQIPAVLDRMRRDVDAIVERLRKPARAAIAQPSRED